MCGSAGPNRHQSAVTCLQFCRGLVLSSSDDGTVKLWDLRTGAWVRDLVSLQSQGSGTYTLYTNTATYIYIDLYIPTTEPGLWYIHVIYKHCYIYIFIYRSLHTHTRARAVVHIRYTSTLLYMHIHTYINTLHIYTYIHTLHMYAYIYE